MKFKIIFLLVTLVATSGFQALSQTSEPAENQTNRIPATVSWEAQKEHDKWRKLQDAIDLAEETDRKKTVDFRIKVEDQAKQGKLGDAENLLAQVESGFGEILEFLNNYQDSVENSQAA